MAIGLFHIRDSSECANVNGPNTNSPLYDNKAGRNRRSTKWQPLEVQGKTRCPNVQSSYSELLQQINPQLQGM